MKSIKKRMADSSSQLWRNKADKAWRILVLFNWKSRCAICGSIDNIQAHHLIPREMCSHRHIPLNGIILCASHHKYSFLLSPHKAPVSFFKWFMDKYPEIWAWLLDQEPNRNKIDYKSTFNNLKKEIDALEQRQSETH